MQDKEKPTSYFELQEIRDPNFKQANETIKPVISAFQKDGDVLSLVEASVNIIRRYGENNAYLNIFGVAAKITGGLANEEDNISNLAIIKKAQELWGITPQVTHIGTRLSSLSCFYQILENNLNDSS